MTMSQKPGIYIHLPFCAIHCSYCDFTITTRRALASTYYDALLKEMDMNPLARTADTLYFGGGTPSLTPSSILGQIRHRFQMEKNSETTLEANPDDINDSTIQEWLEIGINRISIGVQSLEDQVLRSFLRKHTTDEGVEAVGIARKSGCSNLNVDLILGAPHQTQDGFLQGLERLIDVYPQHFSLYLLEIHDTTLLARQLREGKTALMDEETQLECYRSATDILRNAGYLHYEVSNFALPGFESRHNLKYWMGTPYFAYGAGASSYIPPFRIQNLASVTAYIEALQENKLPIERREEENADTRMRNALIFGLRKADGVDLKEFENEFHVSPVSLFGSDVQSFLEAGWIKIENNKLRLTLSGMLVSNEILTNVI